MKEPIISKIKDFISSIDFLSFFLWAGFGLCFYGFESNIIKATSSFLLVGFVIFSVTTRLVKLEIGQKELNTKQEKAHTELKTELKKNQATFKKELIKEIIDKINDILPKNKP